MKKLHISTALSLPLEAITETIAVLGIRGSGKTNTCVVLTEELLDAGQQVVIIDPTDVWWGLKSSKNGKEAGYPVVVFGGRHGDVPLTAADGATVADFVVEERLPAILSLRHFESQSDMRRFVTDFARRLYHRKGEEGRDTPMLLAIDEGHLFVPQRVGAAEAQMVGAIQKLVRQGRTSGIGVAIIDQRAASVNKDVLTQLELLICHRTSSPQDRKALEAWIEQHDTANQKATFLGRLPELARGVAWCWSPGWLDIFKEVPVRERHTFDSSATPKAGEKRVTPTTLAHVDLDALKKKMADAIEKAGAEDPKALRARIAQLERQLASRVPAPPPVEESVVLPWLSQADIAEVHRYIEALGAAHNELIQKSNAAFVGLGEWFTRVETPRPVDPSDRRVKRVTNGIAKKKLLFEAPPRVEHPRAEKPKAESSIPGLSPVEKKILCTLAAGGAMDRKKLALWSGYSHTSGSFGQALADLREAGDIVGSSKELSITSEGRTKVAGHVEKLPKGEALLEWWIAKRPSGDGLVLRALARGGPMSREDIAAAIDRSNTSGSYGQTLADLRALGLIDGTSKAYDLSPELR